MFKRKGNDTKNTPGEDHTSINATSTTGTTKKTTKRKHKIPSIKCPQCGFKAKLKYKFDGRRANRTEMWGEYQCYSLHITRRILNINVDK